MKVSARIVSDGSTVGSLGRRREGSGVVLDPTTVLTIGYLVVESESVEVETVGGKRLPATLAGYDHATGFGLLRVLVPVDAPAAPLGDSDAVAVNQIVLTAGFGEPRSTPILAVSRQPFAGGWEYLLESPIFTYPPVSNWSGAALFDGDGRLVGVGSLIVDDARVTGRKVPGNLFVPINLLKPILADLQKQGRRSGPVAPWLGLTTEWQRDALVVLRVAPQGPAERAGIARGDRISAVAGMAITDQADFYRKVLAGGAAGTTLTLTIRQESGEQRRVRVTSIDRETFLKRAAGI
ncbi:MAG: S1C family serine protease [Lautropia sp.]